VLEALAGAWRGRRAELARSAAQLVEAVRHSSTLQPSTDPLTESVLAAAARGLRHGFDPRWGGWGRAPKFPPASALEFLLRHHLRTGDEEPLQQVVTTLDGMALGGMYDLVGGGFHRYSVDERWLVPHFEKMLYDNALLVPAYLHGWLVTGRERYREVVEETVEYLRRELLLEHGGFASAQDADTEGVEGLTFTWTEEEGVPAELLEPFEHGRSVIRGELDPELRRRLFAEREERPKPLRDDKAIASWNGLATAALAEAGRVLDRRDWVEHARSAAEFVDTSLSDADGRLLRSYRDGRTSGAGYLDDYANVAHGLLELHVATGELRWLEEANRLARLAVELFGDEERGGFFLADREREPLVARTKPLDDHPLPSGNSMLAHVLLRLGRIYGDEELERRAVAVFRLLHPALERAPSAFGWALCALGLWFSPPRELAIVGDLEADVARAALAPWQPDTVVAIGPADTVPLLAGKGLVDGRTAVYACERFTCHTPVTDANSLHLESPNFRARPLS
jgi:uncharacterized protein YyaL (SSP411 family)